MSPNNTVTVIERSPRPPPIDVSRGLFNLKKWLQGQELPNSTAIAALITDINHSPWLTPIALPLGASYTRHLPVELEPHSDHKRGFDPLDEAVPAKRRRRDS